MSPKERDTVAGYFVAEKIDSAQTLD